MKNYIIKTILIFSVIYAFVIGVIFFMFSSYQTTFQNNYANDLGYQQHQVYSEVMNDKYQTDFNYFVDITEDNSVDILNSNPANFNYGDLIFNHFYELTEDSIIINGVSYLINDLVFFNRNYRNSLSFYNLSDILVNYNDDKLYGVYYSDSVIGLFDAQNYIKNLMPQHADNILLMRPNGFILHSYDSLNVNLLSEYIETSTNPIYQNIISENKSGSLWTEINDDDYLLALSPINDANIYFVSAYDKDDLLINFRHINLYLLTTLIVIGMTFILANLLTFYASFVRFTDIENARVKVYFNKRMIMRVNLKGKIIGYSKGFKSSVINYDKYKYLNDFRNDEQESDISLFERAKRGFSFTLQMETIEGNAFVKFIPLKMGLQYVLIGDNLSKDDLLLREYESLALINSVTKVPNYNFYSQYMKDFLKSVKLDESTHAVIALNILDFKSINKLVGEKVANETLVDFVQTLKNALKDYKYELFNTYVDNFIIVLHDIKSVEEVEMMIDNLAAYLEATTNLAGTTLNLDIRAGIYEISNLSSDELNSELMFERAMIALKHANNSTTSKYSLYDVTLKEYISQRQRLEKSLIEAIENKEFIMHLQPQLNILTNKISSFEALIRWNNPKYNHISPQEFIRLAEENNLIIKIGKIVMEETAKIAKQLEKFNITIAMNISPVQMIQKGFVNSLKEIIEKYNIKPHTLAVEITETFMVNSMQLMSEKLKVLQNMGVDIHLDDFGMGYSSLLYLKDLPINMIKIDKTFVDNITTDRYSKAIVNMIVSLSKNIGVDVIAEGVETEIQKAALQKAGVPIIQGWLVAKALPLEEAVELLNTFNTNTKR